MVLLPSKLIRKVPFMIFASEGVSLGSSLSRVVWEAIIISFSWETLEVSSACSAWGTENFQTWNLLLFLSTIHSIKHILSS